MFHCIENLARYTDYKIILVETTNNKNYPIKFSSTYFKIVTLPEFKNLIQNIVSRDIQKVFITGWGNSEIRYFTKYFYKNNVNLILLSDQPLKNSFRQKIGKKLFQRYLRKFKYVIVPGKAGYDLMRYYGVNDENIRTGLYTATNKIFCHAKVLRDNFKKYPKVFLFDGQFIKRKGVEFLIKEYSQYRKLSKEPWELVMVGKGELEHIIPPFVKNLGFVHQDNLGDIYANAGCFVLPSYEDHWGVVIHQAVTAGLPLLVSPFCMSHYDLFRENENGFFINPLIEASLTQAMLKIEKINDEKLKEMGKVSFQLSKSYSTEKWVENMKTLIEN
jgi:glycosyltransferase involved in cell wall biosynthesis